MECAPPPSGNAPPKAPIKVHWKRSEEVFQQRAVEMVQHSQQHRPTGLGATSEGHPGQGVPARGQENRFPPRSNFHNPNFAHSDWDGVPLQTGPAPAPLQPRNAAPTSGPPRLPSPLRSPRADCRFSAAPPDPLDALLAPIVIPELEGTHSSRSRRPRRTYTAGQLRVLEEAFGENPKPDFAERQRLSERTGVPEDRIQVWFQNRRARTGRSSSRRNPPTAATAASFPASLPGTAPLHVGYSNSNASAPLEPNGGPSAAPPDWLWWQH